MPIPIFNSVASFFLKRRISQIELFKDYPIEVQQEVLRKLVVYSIDTEIGKKNDFLLLCAKLSQFVANK